LSDGRKTCFTLKENAMFNYYYNPVTEKPKTWRSAYEIEMAALKHEERRIQMMYNNASQAEGDRKAGFLSFLRAPLQMLAALIG